MSISVAIVEDLDEVREGLSNMIALHPEFKIVGTFKDAEEAIPAIRLLSLISSSWLSTCPVLMALTACGS